MTQERSDIINIAKAIGIILMVIGHSGCPQWLHDFIYVFHMPLFFFLSGYCMKELYLDEKWLFVKKRMKRVWWTFVKWNILFFAANPLFFFLGVTDEYYPIAEMPEVLGQVLTMRLWHELLGPFWFLRYLLISNLVVIFTCWSLRRWQRLTHLVFMSMPVIPMLLSMLGVTDSLKGQGLLCCFFCYIGFISRNRTPSWSHWRFTLSVVATIVASIFVKTEIPLMQPRLTLIYAVAAIIGIYATMTFCSLLTKKSVRTVPAIVFVGRNTIPIMVWHLLAFKIVSAITIAICHLPSSQLFYITITPNTRFCSLWIAYSLVGIGVPLLLIKLKDSCLRNK